MPEINKDLQQDLTWLVKNNIFKRFLITEKYVVAWTTLANDIAISVWKRFAFESKLRLVPNLPLENGATQEYWNHMWDSAIAVAPGVRYM